MTLLPSSFYGDAMETVYTCTAKPQSKGDTIDLGWVRVTLWLLKLVVEYKTAHHS